MEFTADDLERAVAQFYQCSSDAQAQAHHFLTAAKASPQAWHFVWGLLQPHKSTEVQFYGATTLHTKVEKSLDELTPEQIINLKDQLLASVVTYSTGPKIVLNRLCVALSAYVLRTCPERWKGAIPELLHTFTPENLPNVPVNRILWVQLEILSIIPEEFSCMHFTAHQKGLRRHELESSTGQVTGLLESLLSSQTDEELILQAVKCVASWASVVPILAESENMANLLVSWVFKCHSMHSGICEKSLEALNAMLVHPLCSKYPNRLMDFLSKILTLRELIARELMTEEPDKEMVRNLYSLLITFGETHTSLLITWLRMEGAPREHVMALITALLHCSGAPGAFPVDEVHSRSAFGFWYILQDQLFLDDLAGFEMSILRSVYRELVDVLMVKAKLPVNPASLSREDAETFRCYRQDIGDTMMYCYRILRETTLSLIQSRLQKVNSEETSWQEIEACLFALCSIAENVDLEESAYLPTLFQYIRYLPFERLDPKVLSAALDNVGAYAEWIAANSGAIEHVLPLITLGLNVPEAVSSATMAMKDFTRDCETAILPYASVLLNASRECLHAGRLKPNDAVRLMYSVGRLLGMLPPESLYQSLDLALAPYFTQLQSISNQQMEYQEIPQALLLPEILTKIFTFLDTESKGRVSQVCTGWRDAAYGKSVWRDVEAVIEMKRTSNVCLFPSLQRRGIKKLRLLSCQSLRVVRSLISDVPSMTSLVLQEVDEGKYYVSNEALRLISLGFPNLEVIKLISCNYVSDNGVRCLKDLRNLKSVVIMDCQPTPEAKRTIETCLNLLGTAMTALDAKNEISNSPHPVLLMLDKLLPVLKVTASVWSHEPSIMQAIFVVLKHAVSNLRDDSEPVIGEILNLIVTSYRVYPEPKALEVARQIFLLFGKQEKCIDVMKNLLLELCLVTMAHVSPSNMAEHADLLVEFFNLQSTVCKRIPGMQVYWSNDHCVNLVQCAMMTLGLHELPAVKASVIFLVNFITQSRDEAHFSNVINVCGQHLVQKIISLIGGVALRNNVEPLADILLALNKKYCDNLSRWLRVSVCEELCNKANAQQRENFIRSVLKERTNKRKLQEVVQEFTLICRGLIGVETVRSLSSF